MNWDAILAIVLLGIALLGTLAWLVISLLRGEMKKTIQELMVEAEKTGKSGPEKLKYVVEAFCKKYKIFQFLLNCKKFVEKIIELSKQINAK